MSHSSEILIVDDEPIVCERLKAFISKEGHQVETYISKRSQTKFSHGICPDCYKRLLDGEIE